MFCIIGVMPHDLTEGLRRFRTEAFPKYREHFQRLVDEGQSPRTLFIGCADSRVVPDLITGADPGDLFVVRNIGAWVPPFEPDAGYHGTSAGIEFAVLSLNVSDIVVCGHSHCGAVRALYDPPGDAAPHITRWLELAEAAKLSPSPLASDPVDEDALRRTERRAVALQLEHLLTFPMVAERVDAGTLALHGWHYVIEEGRVDVLDVGTGEFGGRRSSLQAQLIKSFIRSSSVLRVSTPVWLKTSGSNDPFLE